MTAAGPHSPSPGALTIGRHRLHSRFLLAPMAGITDAPFRRLCRHFGAGMTTSEMTTADIRLWRTAKSMRRLDLDMDAEPRVVQIVGSEPARLALAARLCVDRGAQIIDINMGCPARKVCKRLAGSALLQDERLVARILEAVVRAVDVPVTLKIRTGRDPEHRNGLEIARIAEGSGIRALAVHGRTRACRFKGEAEYGTIARIKQGVSIPVIANGDITSSEKSLEVLHLTGADGLMIGRAAQGRPWIFREMSCSVEHNQSFPPLEKKFLRDIMLDHLSGLYQFYGETTGVRVARKHLSWYCTGLTNSEAFRFQAVRADRASEQLRLTRQYFDRTAGDACAAWKRRRSVARGRATSLMGRRNRGHIQQVPKKSQKKDTELRAASKKPLRKHAEEALRRYFATLNGDRPGDLYDLVMGEVEEPLFKAVMDYTQGNQSQAAGILGINRGTLRKKLKTYSLLQ